MAENPQIDQLVMLIKGPLVSPGLLTQEAVSIVVLVENVEAENECNNCFFAQPRVSKDHHTCKSLTVMWDRHKFWLDVRKQVKDS